MSYILNLLSSLFEKIMPKKFGERGHIEYNWINELREKIVQFNYQLVRTNDFEKLLELEKILYDIIIQLKNNIDRNDGNDENNGNNGNNQMNVIESINMLKMMYLMIGHTRDIVQGKGEYNLSYMMIYVWYQFYPDLALYALKSFMDEELFINSDSRQPYGSWKDFKYFCDYYRTRELDKIHKKHKDEHYDDNENDNDNDNRKNVSIIDIQKINYDILSSPIIEYIVSIVNGQLRKDYTKYIGSSENETISLTLVAKWIPRENKKFGYLYEKLACNYFSEYFNDSSSVGIIKKVTAIRKAKMNYRKILTTLNRYLDTTQIKQCENNWANIDFNKVTSITLHKQMNAFFKKYDNDRLLCSVNLKNYTEEIFSKQVELKGKRIGLEYFTRQALKINSMKEDFNRTYYDESSELINTLTSIINSQWKNNSTQNCELCNFIPFLDFSEPSNKNHNEAGIALAIRIAEKSLFGKRLLTFSSSSNWVNLDECNGFVDMVDLINKSNERTNSNFYDALNVILNAIVEMKLSADSVKSMGLIILSDMQFDIADFDNSLSVYEQIQKKYSETGIKVHGKPYQIPHIIFWNLRNTNSFPCVSTNKNCTMLSGYSPLLLNTFCTLEFNGLKTMTPSLIVEKMLFDKRYDILGKKFDNILK